MENERSKKQKQKREEEIYIQQARLLEKPLGLLSTEQKKLLKKHGYL